MTQQPEQDNLHEIRAAVQDEIQSSGTDQQPTSENNNGSFSEQTIFAALADEEDGDASVLIDLLKGRYVYDHAAGQWFRFTDHY